MLTIKEYEMLKQAVIATEGGLVVRVDEVVVDFYNLPETVKQNRCLVLDKLHIRKERGRPCYLSM